MTARTWHVHLALQMPKLSQQDEVMAIFKEILSLQMSGFQFLAWNNFCFHMMDGIADIDGYLHVNETSLLADTAVRT
jgi:hypothetical protein